MSKYVSPPRRPRCQICFHPDRQAIEQQIINEIPMRRIALQWGWTYVEGRTGKVMGDHVVIKKHRDVCMAADYAHFTGETRDQTGRAITERLNKLDEHVDAVLARLTKGEPVLNEGIPLLNPDGSPLTRFKDQLILQAVKEARNNLDARWRFASGAPDPDNDAVDAARAAMSSPEARSMLARVEEFLASKPKV